MSRFNLHLYFVSRNIQVNRAGAFLFAPTPFGSFDLLTLKFLDAVFYSCKLLFQLVSVLFQPFLFLFCGYETPKKHTASTPTTAAGTSPSYLCPLAPSRLTHLYHPLSIKYLSNNLNVMVKKFVYFFLDSISLILSLTVLSSFCNSFSYFLSDSELAPLSSFSLNLPVPRHPHVQTSFNICRQFSNAFSSIEYGIQYPFLSLLARPDCLSIFRCCDTAAGVMPISSAIFLTPSGPLDFRRSIILTRVSTDNTLNISEGSNFIFFYPYLVKQFSNYLIKILKKSDFVKCFIKIFLEVKKNEV